MPGIPSGELPVSELGFYSVTATPAISSQAPESTAHTPALGDIRKSYVVSDTYGMHAA